MDSMQIEINDEIFKTLPLVAEGESKIIKYLGGGYCATKYKPTIYSFTHNRCAVVEGSDIERVRATKVFLKVLKMHGIPHSYIDVVNGFIISKLLLEEASERNPNPFRPDDISIMGLKYVPNIEVIVKRYLTGTTKHQLHGFSGSTVYKGHSLFEGFKIENEEPFPIPIVRFDWRNPLKDENGTRLDDKALPEDLASFFINTKKAKLLALKTYNAISDFLNHCDIICQDVCLFSTTDGQMVFGEISQDCGRFRHYYHGNLDKDVWRAGGSSAEVLTKWKLLSDILEEKIETYNI